MKTTIIIIMLIAMCLVAQEWDHSEWQEYNLYKDGELLGGGENRFWEDVKCYQNGDCYAVSFHKGYFLEVYLLDEEMKRWDMVYDGNWDIFSPPEEWPDLPIQPRLAKIYNDSIIFITYDHYPILNKFNWKQARIDSVRLPQEAKPDYINFSKNGFGLMSAGVWSYFTFDDWETISSYKFNFPSSAILRPSTISNGKLNIVDYFEDNCYNLTSEDGKQWERKKIGNFYASEVYFFDKNIGFVVGQRSRSENQTSDDVIYKTTDGGITWGKVLDQYNDPGSWGLFSVTFLNDSIGIATSKTSMLYTTTDQGETWEYAEMEQLESDIFISRVHTSGDKVFLLTNAKSSMYIYDATLLGITSVPFFKYKELTAYPNPFNNSINIQSDAVTTGDYNIKIYDVNSELVYEDVRFISGELKLNLELSTGAYFLLLEGKDYYYKKIIRE